MWGQQRQEDPITVFMGVPTMYTYLLNYYKEMSAEEQEGARAAASRLRLTVSGSSACPLPVMQRWRQLSGSGSHHTCTVGSGYHEEVVDLRG